MSRSASFSSASSFTSRATSSTPPTSAASSVASKKLAPNPSDDESFEEQLAQVRAKKDLPAKSQRPATVYKRSTRTARDAQAHAASAGRELEAGLSDKFIKDVDRRRRHKTSATAKDVSSTAPSIIASSKRKRADDNYVEAADTKKSKVTATNDQHIHDAHKSPSPSITSSKSANAEDGTKSTLSKKRKAEEVEEASDIAPRAKKTRLSADVNEDHNAIVTQIDAQAAKTEQSEGVNSAKPIESKEAPPQQKRKRKALADEAEVEQAAKKSRKEERQPKATKNKQLPKQQQKPASVTAGSLQIGEAKARDQTGGAKSKAQTSRSKEVTRSLAKQKIDSSTTKRRVVPPHKSSISRKPVSRAVSAASSLGDFKTRMTPAQQKAVSDWRKRPHSNTSPPMAVILGLKIWEEEREARQLAAAAAAAASEKENDD